MRAELLQLMVKFQLCFQVPGSGSSLYRPAAAHAEGRPVYHWDESDNLVLRYEYDVMPKGIVRRLIVALHYQIAPGGRLWRSGAVFAYEGSEAEVIEVYRRRLLTIRIRGGDPRVLLGLIDKELGIIHRSYPGIRFKRFMPCDCEICSTSDDPTMFEVGELKDFAQTGDQIQCRRSRGLRDPVRVAQAAVDRRAGPPSGRSSPWSGRPRAPRAEPVQPEIFVSYSWGGDSEALVDEIQHRMAERGVLVTRDKSEIGYRDSIQRFMQRIGAGKCVIVILEPGLPRIQVLHVRAHPDRRPPRVRRPRLPGRHAGRGDLRRPDQARVRQVLGGQAGRTRRAMKEISQEHLEGIRDDLDLYEDIGTRSAG